MRRRLAPASRLLGLALLTAGGPAGAAAPLSLEEEHTLFYGILEPTGLVGSATGAHVVQSDDLQAQLCLEPSKPTSLRGRLVVDVRHLELNTERARAAEGLEDATRSLLERPILDEIKGERGLDVQRYPTIAFTIEDVTRLPGGGLAFSGPLTLHGITREVQIPVEVTPTDEGGFRYDGRLSISQATYGVRPLSIPGMLRVEDALVLRVILTGAPGQGPCPG